MTDHRERAEALMRTLEDYVGVEDVRCFDDFARLVDALRAVADEAFEQAAVLAETQPNFIDTVEGKRQNWVKAEIAEKIRALKLKGDK